MKRIYNNSDVILDLSRLASLLENADSLIVQLFTTNISVYAEYSLEDMDDNYQIIVTYDFIKDIGRGVVNCRYNIGYDDSVYPDGERNKIGQFTTDFFLDSDTIVPEDLNPHILDGVVWGNISGSISNQNDLRLALAGKVGYSAYNQKVNEIESTLEEKVDYTTLDEELTTIENNLDLKANTSDLTALQTQVDNLPTSEFVNALNAKIDNHKNNSTIHVTAEDKARWNNKADAGDYATNSDLQEVSDAVDNVNYQLNNTYYTKTQTDNKIGNEIANVNGNIQRLETNLENNYISKVEVEADYLSKEDAADTYQPKGEYTTVNYVNNNFQRKSEPVIVPQTETTVEIQPNVLNVWGKVASLTITFAAVDATKYNEFMIQFVSGATPTTLTLPNTVSWLTEASIEANTTYQISIVNNLGIMEGWQ